MTHQWKVKLKWERKAVSARGNGSSSARAIVFRGDSLSAQIGFIIGVLDQRSENKSPEGRKGAKKSVAIIKEKQLDWDVFHQGEEGSDKGSSKQSCSHSNGRVGSRSMWHSGGWCGSATALTESSFSKPIFTGGKRVPTKALASTRSGHFNGWVVLKVFCSSFSKRAGWPIEFKVFKIVKTGNLVNTLGWSRGMLSMNGKSHIICYVLTLRIFGTPKKLHCRQNCEGVFNQLNSTNWVDVERPYARVTG